MHGVTDIRFTACVVTNRMEIEIDRKIAASQQRCQPKDLHHFTAFL
jgi:hypothetical protein